MSADRNALVDALKAGADALALALLGEPNRLLSNKSSWRYGRNGSFVLEVAGSRRGLWFSHEDGEGGGPLQLIQREQGLDAAGAFRWAREWLGGSFQEGDSRSPKSSQRPTPSSANDNRALETKGDPAADARLIMLRSEAVAGTLAEVYLRRHRAIDGLLPESLRFIPSHWSAEVGQELPALVVSAFEGGEIRRAQLVFLHPRTGARALNPKTSKPIAKRTFGKLAAHIPARFASKAPSARFDLVLTEGPEDAISLWSVLPAGEVATVLGKGNLGKPELAPDVRLLIVADNDPNSGGLQTAQKAAVEHTLRGCQVWIATPPAGIKDSNDLLRAAGAAGILAMLDAAEPFQPAPAEGAAVAALDAAEAAERSRQAIARFIEQALAWQPEPEPSDDSLDFNSALPAPVVGVRGSLGLGKTQHILELLVRPELADKHVSFYAPEHRLNGELLERFRAMAGPDSPRAMVIFGREQTKPDGTVMCPKADLVRKIAPLKVNIQSHLCERRRKTDEIDPETGKRQIEVERCEHFESCAYQQQRRDREPGVRFLSHAHLFIKGAVPRADLAIVDEDFAQGALRGTDVRFHKTPDGIVATGGYFVSLGSLQLPRRGLSDSANADLVAISQRCTKAIYAGGSLKNFQDAGVTAEAVTEAMTEEYKRLEKLAVSPAMPRARQEAAISRYREQEARRFAQFFALVAASLNGAVDPCADRLELVRDVRTDEGVEDRVYLYWRASVRAPRAPTLIGAAIAGRSEWAAVRVRQPWRGHQKALNFRLKPNFRGQSRASH